MNTMTTSNRNLRSRAARRVAQALLVLAVTPVLVGAASSTSGAAVNPVYKVGTTGLVQFYEPECTNYGYDFVAKTCTYGHADVYQYSSSNPVYKDVNVWANGTLIQSTRVVTQCTPGANLCGMTNVWTVWMYPGMKTFANDSFKFTATKGVTYTFQTKVWFWENGKWISGSLTRQITA